jgi:hypothetical protein
MQHVDGIYAEMGDFAATGYGHAVGSGWVFKSVSFLISVHSPYFDRCVGTHANLSVASQVGMHERPGVHLESPKGTVSNDPRRGYHRVARPSSCRCLSNGTDPIDFRLRVLSSSSVSNREKPLHHFRIRSCHGKPQMRMRLTSDATSPWPGPCEEQRPRNRRRLRSELFVR